MTILASLSPATPWQEPLNDPLTEDPMLFFFAGMLEIIGAIILFCIALFILVLGKRLAQRSDAVAYLVSLFRSMLGFTILSFTITEILLLFLRTQTTEGFRPWNSIFIFVIMIGIFASGLAIVAGSVFKNQMAPPWAGKLPGWAFIISFIGSLVIFGYGPYPDWLGRGVIAILSWQLALSAHISVALILLIANVLSNFRLRTWYRDLTAQLISGGAYDECIAACKAAISISFEAHDFKASFLNLIGACYFRKREFEEALDYYTQAITFAPITEIQFGATGIKKAVAYTNRAEALIELGRYKEAADACDKALAIDPRDSYASKLRAEVMIRNPA